MKAEAVYNGIHASMPVKTESSVGSMLIRFSMFYFIYQRMKKTMFYFILSDLLKLSLFSFLYFKFTMVTQKPEFFFSQDENSNLFTFSQFSVYLNATSSPMKKYLHQSTCIIKITPYCFSSCYLDNIICLLVIYSHFKVFPCGLNALFVSICLSNTTSIITIYI